MMMTKQKKAVSCLLCIILLLTGLYSAAAESSAQDDSPGGKVVIWKVVAPEFNTEALLDYTFDRKTAEQAPEIEEEIRENNEHCWDLKGNNGVPFCSVGPVYPESAGIQNRISLTRHADEGDERNYWYYLDEDNILSGKSGYENTNKLTETFNRALIIMQDCGLLTEPVSADPLSYSALGRMEGASESHKVLLGETLDDLPLRWAANALGNGTSSMRPMTEGCYAELIFSDEDGLLYATASWCGFEPLVRKYAEERLTYEQGWDIFWEAGIQCAEMETCWFLSMDGDGAIATLAWRVGNNYLSAVDGTWLQTEK